jgi:hypothetical protein
MPADVNRRLAELESTRLADREVIADLTAKMARLEAENRSMRQWTTDRFMAMWETSNSRDVNVVQALHDIHALQVEENARQIRMERTAANLEILLQIPALPLAMSGPTEPSVPEVAPSPTLPDKPEIPVSDSKKREGSVGLESEAKRLKL